MEQLELLRHEVSAEKVKQAARAMVESGLVNYGWTYINIDDSWQHHRDPNDRPEVDGCVTIRVILYLMPNSLI